LRANLATAETALASMKTKRHEHTAAYKELDAFFVEYDSVLAIYIQLHMERTRISRDLTYNELRFRTSSVSFYDFQRMEEILTRKRDAVTKEIDTRHERMHCIRDAILARADANFERQPPPADTTK